VRCGGAGIQKHSDNSSCAVAKGELEEGGFPGRAYVSEEDPRPKHTPGTETVNLCVEAFEA